MEGVHRDDAGDGGTTDTWLREHSLMLVAATRHPFILSIRDGSVDIDSFKRWLVGIPPAPPVKDFIFIIGNYFLIKSL